MTQLLATASPSRLRTAAFSPIGEEGRAELVESRLVQAISSGAFVEGDRLPSESELSQMLGVAVVTVREALGALRYRGLISTKRGRSGGSFVTQTHGAIEEINARRLMAMPRVALSDLATHYEAIAAACAEYACQRATAEELEVVWNVLIQAEHLPRAAWRRRITDAQLELAALSQSVRLTNEHVRLQAEFTPLLALQDADADQRAHAYDALMSQVEAIRRGDASEARRLVHRGVRQALRWLTAFRAELLALPTETDLRAIFDARPQAAE